MCRYRRLNNPVSSSVTDRARSRSSRRDLLVTSRSDRTTYRALRSVVEELMLELMYELPEQKREGAGYEITAEVVTADQKPTLFTAKKRKRKKESA